MCGIMSWRHIEDDLLLEHDCGGMEVSKLEENLLDPNYLEEVLGSFSEATGLRIEAINNSGETFAIPGNQKRCEFCRLIRSHPIGEKKCRNLYERAGREASKWEEAYFFRCHAGLVMWAVPIVVNGASLGSIICGQVLLWEPDEYFLVELKKLIGNLTNFEALLKDVPNLKVVSPTRAQAAADMLFVVVNHIVKRNIHVLEEIHTVRTQQQIIREELETRKKEISLDHYDYDSYLKNERTFLRYIRLGDRAKVESHLKSLLIDLYSITLGDKLTIKHRLIELSTLVSRAAVDGGINSELAILILNDYHKEVDKTDKLEELFFRTNQIVKEFSDNIFTLSDKKHLGIVNMAREYIIDNFQKPINIEDIAQFLFISSSHLSRLFREELDCTVNNYLTRVRIEKAVELIKKPELSVEQVSRAVGIKSQSYFTKIFKEYIGVAPLVYRNSLS